MAAIDNYNTKDEVTVQNLEEDRVTNQNRDEKNATVRNNGSLGRSGTATSFDSSILGFTYNDKMDMKRMGKEQELMRDFETVSSIAFTTCVMGTWEILLTANTQGWIAGGSAGLLWSLV